MFIYNVFLTFINKRLINGTHKMLLKHSIINGFCTDHFLTQKYLLGLLPHSAPQKSARICPGMWL